MNGFRITSALVAILLSSPVHAQQAPAADHHQHLFSPALAALISPPAPAMPVAPIDAARLISLLDEAGIQRAVVLSTSYILEQPTRQIDNAREKLRAENDWTSAQVARFPTRLAGFCALNPLTDYARDELARCAKDPHLRHGLKLHLGNSGVNYRDRSHIERLRAVFQAANDYRMPIVVHLRASFSLKLSYGRDEAITFLSEVVPAAPDVVVQVAHFAGGGAPEDPAADDALGVLAEAVAKRDPRTQRLYFDLSGVSGVSEITEARASAIANRIRQIGVNRIFFGSDAATGGGLSPREAWAALRKLPLSEREFEAIAANIAPYLQ